MLVDKKSLFQPVLDAHGSNLVAISAPANDLIVLACSPLILRGFLGAIDHEDRYGSFARFELQTELLLESGEDWDAGGLGAGGEDLFRRPAPRGGSRNVM